ncbi:MAG TPA: hypothetical protein VNF07_00430 [Acidimicrobiales bacterium]|nr:hypothetical protein [Acidimicrobiales bacterium]
MATPRVALVTEHWGAAPSEAVTVTRLLAGALARSASVEVVHLTHAPRRPAGGRDSVFGLHELPVTSERHLHEALVRTALARAGRPLSPALEAVAAPFATVEGLAGTLAAIAPDAIVLTGHEAPLDPADLEATGVPLTFVPILGDLGRIGEQRIARLVDGASRVLSVNPAEEEALRARYPARSGAIVPLELALPLNRAATGHMLFGVHWFGRYVLLIRSFPPGGHRYARSVTRELLSSLLGVSVAEVDGERFTISDRDNAVDLPVNPTRVNLWRLMAHAAVTIDARPAGPFGQEAIESLLLGTPVVVPAGSAAHAVARASGGGLSYVEPGDLVDAARSLLRPGAGEEAGAAGRSWAETTHGDAERFVTHLAGVVLGGGRQAVAASSPAAMPSRMSDSE